MKIDLTGATALLLQLYPEYSSEDALGEALVQLNGGSLAAAASWTRMAAQLMARENEGQPSFAQLPLFEINDEAIRMDVSYYPVGLRPSH